MKTILAIDDAKPILAIIKYVFREKYEVVNKLSAIEALDWMQEGNLPDVIITDLNMPEMDGFKFLKHIKASGIFCHIPVIVLTSIEHTTDKIQCLKAGAEDYIVKPFNPIELEARVENLLKRQMNVTL